MNAIEQLQAKFLEKFLRQIEGRFQGDDKVFLHNIVKYILIGYHAELIDLIDTDAETTDEGTDIDFAELRKMDIDEIGNGIFESIASICQSYNKLNENGSISK